MILLDGAAPSAPGGVCGGDGASPSIGVRAVPSPIFPGSAGCLASVGSYALGRGGNWLVSPKSGLSQFAKMVGVLMLWSFIAVSFFNLLFRLS